MSFRMILVCGGVLALALGRTAGTVRAAVSDCTANDTQIYGKAAFVDSGMSFRSDGLGMYIHDKKKVQVTAQSALNIFPFQPGTPGRPQRHVVVDLNNPVPGGGGVPRGVVNSRGGPHSFWYLDASMHVHGVRDIPVGATTDSDLTAIFITSDDGTIAYLLQMGPWAWSTCEDAGPVQTAGSTRAIITRTDQKTWSVTAPSGSTGVLHDMQNPQNPIPLGLYYINFHIDYVF